MHLLKKLKNSQLFLYFRNADNLYKFLKRNDKTLFPKIAGIYFGEEFCEYLAPPLNEVKRIYKDVKSAGKSLTFVTTVSSIRLLDYYEKIFAFLNECEHMEVVFNDWGILHLLRKNFKNIKPVLGRLLVKNKRYIYKKYTPARDGLSKKDIHSIAINQLHILRDTNLSIKEYRSFIKSYGIEKIDLDIPPQGIKIPAMPEFNFGFYYPWGYLTGGRTCPYNQKTPFHVPASLCRNKQCRDKINLLTSNDWSIALQEYGNVVLYRIQEEKITPPFTRIIWEMDIGQPLSETLKLITGGLHL